MFGACIRERVVTGSRGAGPRPLSHLKMKNAGRLPRIRQGGGVRKRMKRKKKPSKPYRDQFGHTPLSPEKDLSWTCPRWVVC